jgi:hypothetical protein
MLDPSLVRRHRRPAADGAAPPLTEAGLRAVERQLIERARAAGLAGDLCELELLARLQHHGAATRLLDCSRNAFVALWFACRWEPDRDGVLLGFELGDNAVHLDTEPLRHDIEELRRSTSDGDRSGSGRATSASARPAPFLAPR